VKLTDDELRRLKHDAPRYHDSKPESFGAYLTRERFNGIIDELLAARRVIAVVSLLREDDCHENVDNVLMSFDDYEKVTR